MNSRKFYFDYFTTISMQGQEVVTMEKKKKAPRQGVVISGAYGMDNAGDDAVLSAILAQLRAIDRAMPITVLARQPRATARRFGVTAVHPFRPLGWLRAMGRAKVFISGGGTLLQDTTSRRSLLYYLFTIWAAHRQGCAVMLYGCGIGPLGWPRGRALTAKALNQCAQVITLRDGDSMALLQQLGVTAPKMLLSADPALSLPSTSGQRERCLGVCLRPWPGLEKQLPALAQGLRRAYGRYRLVPVFLCLAPGDKAPAQQVMKLLSDIPCRLTIDWRQGASMSLVLSMRLHGLVFALRGETPAAGLSYDDKVASFCREAGYPFLGLTDITAPALEALLDQAIHLDGETLSAAAGQLKARERTNAAALAQLLSETE
jgi:polysaccharide pyruvyl transferase CsaB